MRKMYRAEIGFYSEELYRHIEDVEYFPYTVEGYRDALVWAYDPTMRRVDLLRCLAHGGSDFADFDYTFKLERVEIKVTSM